MILLSDTSNLSRRFDFLSVHRSYETWEHHSGGTARRHKIRKIRNRAVFDQAVGLRRQPSRRKQRHFHLRCRQRINFAQKGLI